MASVKIIGLVAAHFSSKGRSDLKEKFHECLDSIVDQIRPLDKFYLSWSHDNDIEWDVESDVRGRFKEFQSKMSCPRTEDATISTLSDLVQIHGRRRMLSRGLLQSFDFWGYR